MKKLCKTICKNGKKHFDDVYCEIDDIKMYLTSLFDNIIVQLLSTHTGTQPVGITERWCKKTKQKIDVQISYITGHYIKHMEGVDLLDSLRILVPYNFWPYK